MAHVVVTPDDDSYNSNSPTFLVYDSNSKKLVCTCPRLPELDAIELQGQGRPTFRPYGIASDAQHLYVVSHNRLGKFDRQTYKFLGLVGVPLFVNTHKILVHGSRLYTANTSNNTVGVHDLATGVHQYFDVTTMKVTQTVEQPSHAESHDVVHVNSLQVVGNTLYFVLNNLGRQDSQFGWFDVVSFSGGFVAQVGRRAHGVQVVDGKLYSLSSGTGEVIEIDLKTKHTQLYRVVDATKTYLRGLDVLDGQIIFGGSNTYSADRTIYMNNCFTAQFDTQTKKAKMHTNMTDAYIIADMKVLD